MITSGGLELVLSSSLCVLVLIILALSNIFRKLWWNPTRLQKFMALQGVKGPCYTLIHGTNKEILRMQKENLGTRPRNLSHDILSAVQPHIHTWTNKYGKNFLQWNGCQAELVIMEPEMCKEILNNKDGVFPKRKPQSYVKKLLGDSLASSNDEKWGKMRKLANHAFHGLSLKGMIPAMIASTERMLEGWENQEGKEIEVFEQFRTFSAEVISRTAFGSSYLEGNEVFENLMKLCFLIFKNSYTIRLPGISKLFPTSDEIESEKLERAIRDAILEIVKKREENGMNNGKEDRFGSDFLGLLVKARHGNEKERISEDDLVDECKTFYFAGQETTNSMLSWTVFLLALHTDWQEEARKEVFQIFGKQNQPDPNGIAKLKIMGMIINESLRLYPPVHFVERKVKREVKLGNLIVPGDVVLVIPSLAIHHDPEFWGPDVHLFKPQRFSGGVAKATNNNIAAFLPFGMGPRTCVGSNFATTEAKIALSMILQRYAFTLSPGYVHSPYQYLTVRPQHGVQVVLHSL